MVVGIAKYRQTNEAFPLDKKVLNKIALRSLLAGASENNETGSSLGWTWAIAPGLAKIHEDEDDLALAMGHNLEFVSCTSPFSTLAMGIVLALEQQKADPQTIRGVRTAASLAAESIGTAIFKWILIPLTVVALVRFGLESNIAGIAVYAAVLLVASILLRFRMLYYGYSRGTRAAESLIRQKDSLEKAARIAGVCMLGAAVVLFSSSVDFTGWGIRSANTGAAVPGLTGALTAWCVYTGMTKKNWPVYRSVILAAAVGILFALIGVIAV